MSAVLYRKYRPTSFDEVVGQEYVITTIKNSIKKNRIAHAYLFSGPRGTGKTTIARILAKTVNCKNEKDGNLCNKCENCISIGENKFLDLVEIDAATHTQVDKIRDIIEKINFAPTSGKYKVYIIDEVHMLSKGAFNALLKTLEEPPQHVVFILATTEIHKIPATIISRCQRFDFRRLKVSEIRKRLEKIAEKENVRVEKGVLDFIAINSGGGMRDSESLFGQILSLQDDDMITLKEVQTILSVADISIAVGMIELLFDKKYGEAISYINKITDDGYDLEQFAKSIIEYARKLLLIKISPQMKENFSSEMTEEQISELENISQKALIPKTVKIIQTFIQGKEDIKSSVIPQLSLELAVAEIDIADSGLLTNKRADDYNSKIKEPIKKITGKVSQSIKQSQDFIKKSIKVERKGDKEKNIQETEEKRDVSGIEVSDENSISLETIKERWTDILEDVKPYNHSLVAFLKTCQPVSVEKNQVTISCKYFFHKEKLQKIESRKIVEDVMAKALEVKIELRFISQDEAEKMGYKAEKSKTENLEKKDDLVGSALEMFGGKIV